MLRQNYLKLSLIIVGLAGLISLVIIRLASNIPAKNFIANPKPTPNNVAQAFNLEQNKEKLMANVQNLEVKDEDNLTLKVAQELSSKIKQLNASNDLSSGLLQVPQEDVFSEEMIQKYKNDFLKNITPITLNDLKIDNSSATPAAKAAGYMFGVIDILNTYHIIDESLDESINSFIESNNKDFLKDPIINFDKAINGLKGFAISEDFINLHLELLNLLNTQKVVLEAMYNYDKDPVAAVAANELSDNFEVSINNWFVRMIDLTKEKSVYFNLF